MKYQEACAIFGISAEDDEKVIKSKYRQLMQKYHPDAWTGSDDELKHAEAMAMLINEAYKVLKDEQMDTPDQLRSYRWPAGINPHALYERDVYMTGEDGRGRRLGSFKIARGKYYWDPDLEDFDMFMVSVMDLARNLLDQAERKKHISGVDESLRGMYLAKLFSSLSEQYVHAQSCLPKQLSVTVMESEKHHTYSMPAYVGLTGYAAMAAAKQLTEADLLFPEGIRDNRLMIKDGKGVSLGHLSFADDSLYVTVIPLLKQKRCQIRMRYLGASGSRTGRHLKVQLDLRVPKRIGEDDQELMAAGLAMQRKDEVMRIIREYESHIRFL